MRTTLIPVVLILLVSGPTFGEGTKTEIPKLEILSPEGAGRDVKVYNDDGATFFVRTKGKPRGKLLNGATFLLFRAGGSPERASDLIAKSEDPDRWGRPPTSFSLPLTVRDLPVGKYRLRVVKAGYQSAEIGVVQAAFGFTDLDRVHKKDLYRAAMRFHLEDRSETRAKIPLTVIIESAEGAVLDRLAMALVPDPGHRACFLTTDYLRLSSRAKKPAEGKPPVPGRALVIKPGSRLVVYLDRVRFTWRIPLPALSKRGSCGPSAGALQDAEKRGRGR